LVSGSLASALKMSVSRSHAAVAIVFMVGSEPRIPNADSMNGGILSLTCEISHQAVIRVTWLNN